MQLATWLLAFALTAAPLVSESARAQCTGDCDASDDVTVDEIVIMINIALGSVDLTACAEGDASGDGSITVDEIVSALANAMNGCPESLPTFTPTISIPTPSRTSTPTPSLTPSLTPTATPEDTATPLPPASPTTTPMDVTLRVADASGRPGETIQFQVTLSNPGRNVVAIQTDLGFDVVGAPIDPDLQQRPSCKGGTGLEFDGAFIRSVGCPDFESCQCIAGETCGAAACSAEANTTIADGTVLFRCSITISRTAAPGSRFPLDCANAKYVAGDAQFDALCVDGEIVVTP